MCAVIYLETNRRHTSFRAEDERGDVKQQGETSENTPFSHLYLLRSEDGVANILQQGEASLATGQYLVEIGEEGRNPRISFFPTHGGYLTRVKFPSFCFFCGKDL